MVWFPYLHCAGGTLPTLGGGFLMVTTFSLLRAGRLGVLTIWGAVIEPLAPIFMAVCCFLSEGEGKNCNNVDAYPFICSLIKTTHRPKLDWKDT